MKVSSTNKLADGNFKELRMTQHEKESKAKRFWNYGDAQAKKAEASS